MLCLLLLLGWSWCEYRSRLGCWLCLSFLLSLHAFSVLVFRVSIGLVLYGGVACSCSVVLVLSCLLCWLLLSVLRGSGILLHCLSVWWSLLSVGLVALRCLSLMGTCVSMCVERLVHLWLLVPCLFLLLFPTCFFYVLSTVLLTCMLCVPSSYCITRMSLALLVPPHLVPLPVIFTSSLRPSASCFCLLVIVTRSSFLSLLLLSASSYCSSCSSSYLTHEAVVGPTVTMCLVLYGEDAVIVCHRLCLALLAGWW